MLDLIIFLLWAVPLIAVVSLILAVFWHITVEIGLSEEYLKQHNRGRKTK